MSMLKNMRRRAGLLAVLAAGFAPFAVLRAEEPAAAQAPAASPAVDVGQPGGIAIEPSSFVLTGPRAQQQLILTGQYADANVRDLTEATAWESTAPAVAVVENGIVRPKGNGTAQIIARVGGRETRLEVTVRDFDKAAAVSFLNQTVAALSKAGCNAGACHGSPSGKNGFRLSLRGYDPQLDFETLTHEIYGRRINNVDPDLSLILMKPTMQVAHGGGRRLEKGDVSYTILRDWIAEGLRGDPQGTPVLERIEVLPQRRILHKPAHQQQLVVQAYLSDGTVRDVTPLAVYSVSNENVAQVNTAGKVGGVGRGEVAVLVRYLDKMANSRIMFLEDVAGFAWNNPPENSYVDTHVFQKLRKLQILPSDVCTDEEFVRRVYLDAIGKLPTAQESGKFLADQDPQRRRKLIDALLERPEYATFWTLRWGDLLRSNRQKVTLAGIFKFQKWIENAVRGNMPFDRFARELLVSNGSSYDNPAANYYRASRDPADATETTAQLFLGIRMQCAKCHNHPFERWTQDEYYGLSAFFTRVGRKPGSEPEEEVVFVNRGGEVTHPRTGQQVKPWLLLKGVAEAAPEQDRREVFANWLTSADNPFFSKSAVNRIWGYIMGRGIVEPVDDFRDSNPASNDELLSALADDFVKSGFDQKHVIRLILNSRVYQLSSRKNQFNADDETYFSHANTRLLSAEQLLDAICAVTGVPEKFPGLPAGTPATGLPDPKIDNYFLKIFGQPQREMACSCERSNESNLSQALQMINGPTVHGKLRDDGGAIKKLMDGGKSDGEIIDHLYLGALCRAPSPTELEAATKHITSSPDRRQGLEDVGWALLNCKEFLFQH